PVGEIGGQLTAVEFPLFPAAVEQLDAVVAVELEVPVRVGGEPVVVAAVEDDEVVVADALGGQQLLEPGAIHEVTAHRILQFGPPVDLHRARDVAALVGGCVLVDLGEHDTGSVEIVFRPLGGDQYVVTAHRRFTLFPFVLDDELCWMTKDWSRAYAGRTPEGVFSGSPQHRDTGCCARGTDPPRAAVSEDE